MMIQNICRSNIPKSNDLYWILIIIILIAAVLISIFIVLIRKQKALKAQNQLNMMIIENFEEGCVDQINKEMAIGEQAELLPYNKDRFEFPIERIQLGKELGRGAFGVVHKATCIGILQMEKETVTAVKMIKKIADNETFRSLISELKIMVHLGQHLNVLNLLGAVTKNIFNRELMIIVEYCKYGNIQKFLLDNRANFINQINPDTDLIDSSITNHVHDVNRTDEDKLSTNIPEQKNSSSSSNNANGESMGEEILTDNYLQPIWGSDYKSNTINDSLQITTTDLVTWAFQIARGMDYLASRKVLHGDLAARNILLCDHNVVKICDFGLAHCYYKNENYQKNEKAKLPIKWLALETLGERILSIKSDIWSYGVLIWEIFSLSRVPYPSIDNYMLYDHLSTGYRMEKPLYANMEMYKIMLECWNANPDLRPTFSELEMRFSKMLENDISNYYIELNKYHSYINQQYRNSNEIDWFSFDKAGKESSLNMSSIEGKSDNNSEGYMKMEPIINKEDLNSHMSSSIETEPLEKSSSSLLLGLNDENGTKPNLKG